MTERAKTKSTPAPAKADVIKPTEKPAKRTRTEVFKPSPEAFEPIKQQIFGLEERASPDYEVREDVLTAEFTNPTNTIILLRSTEPDNLDEIVGSVYAGPLERYYPSRAQEHPKTAYVNEISVDPDFQRETASTDLFQALGEELVRKGYTHAEGHVLIADRVDADELAEARGNDGFFEVEGLPFIRNERGTKFANSLERIYGERGQLVDTGVEIDRGCEVQAEDDGDGDYMRFIRVSLIPNNP